MTLFHTVETLQGELQPLHRNHHSIGFVPTMGALHQGHLSLIKQARQENDFVVVSIFVNPTQFLVGEDLDKYPKKEEEDRKLCEEAGVDFLFLPTKDSVYKEDEILLKAPKKKGFILEGEKRPGHFDGMLQIVLKLFNIVTPTKAYFGKKDAQQLSLIQQMVKNFYLNIEIVPCEIVRENDGLAMSSRNVYLDSKERELALNISKSLQIAQQTIENGQLHSREIISLMKQFLEKFPEIHIEYIALVNQEFEQISIVEKQNSIILIAVKIGTTRLIDNIWV